MGVLTVSILIFFANIVINEHCYMGKTLGYLSRASGNGQSSSYIKLVDYAKQYTQ